MNKKFFSHFFIISLSVLLSACGKTVTGDGNFTTQDRTVSSFTKIQVAGAYVVNIKKSDQQSVAITSDKNLLPYIETSVKDHALIIKTQAGFNLQSSKDNIVNIMVPTLSDIAVSGATKVNAEVNTKKLVIRLSGASKLVLNGKANQLDIEASGASTVKAGKFIAAEVSLHATGASHFELNVLKSLEVKAAGASQIEYCGTPSVNQNITGASRITQMTNCGK